MASKGAWTLCLLLILKFCASVGQQDSKLRNEDSWKMTINDPKPFRMNKLNLMWEKAKKTLPDSQLPGLYAELVVQDRLEIEWKKRTVEGLDEDGQQEALIHHKFLEILEQFGLRAAYPHESFQKKWSKDASVPASKTSFHDALRTDPKLAALWKKAELAGFTAQELELLKEEFGHHSEKLDEYEQLKMEVDRLEGLSQNSIERFKSDDDEFADTDRGDVVKAKHSQLKSIYRDLKQSYNSLERLTERVVTDAEKSKEFVDPRVRELWSMAVKANLSEEELSSFKTELGHFEHRINKYNHFDKEAQMSKAELHVRGKTDDVLPESHLKLNQKVQEYATKVKKWYTELRNRILKATPHGGDEF